MLWLELPLKPLRSFDAIAPGPTATENPSGEIRRVDLRTLYFKKRKQPLHIAAKAVSSARRELIVDFLKSKYQRVRIAKPSRVLFKSELLHCFTNRIANPVTMILKKLAEECLLSTRPLPMARIVVKGKV